MDQNISELTNYKDQAQITGIFDNEKQRMATENATRSPDRANSNSSSQVPSLSGRRFAPVLKTKTYIKEISTPTKQDFEALQEEVNLNEIQE